MASQVISVAPFLDPARYSIQQFFALDVLQISNQSGHTNQVLNSVTRLTVRETKHLLLH